jgi:hypothetical protein
VIKEKILSFSLAISQRTAVFYIRDNMKNILHAPVNLGNVQVFLENHKFYEVAEFYEVTELLGRKFHIGGSTFSIVHKNLTSNLQQIRDTADYFI